MLKVTGVQNFGCTPVKRTALTNDSQRENSNNSSKYDNEKMLMFGSTASKKKSQKKIFSQAKNHINEESNKKTQIQTLSNAKRDFEIFKNERQTSVPQVLDRASKYLKVFYSDEYSVEQSGIDQANHQKIKHFNKTFRESALMVIKLLRNKTRDFVTHLNTIFFSAPSICQQNYSRIEQQILTQIGENVLITGIVKEWFKCLKALLHTFGSKSFLIFTTIIYQQFCTFIAYLVYDHYRDYFLLQISAKGKKKQNIRKKLTNETARYFIIRHKKWESIVEETFINSSIEKTSILPENLRKKMIDQILPQIKSPALQKKIGNKISEQKGIFLQTKNALIRFMKSSNLRERLKNTLKVRISLEQDILTYQRQLIESGEVEDFFLLEKDQYLTCIILSIISNRLDNQRLDAAIKKSQLMMGEAIQDLLRVYECPSYFHDVVASVHYIKQDIEKEDQEH